ncbi:MAG: hypothetical protein ABJK28_09010 [Algibacter sp.]
MNLKKTNVGFIFAFSLFLSINSNTNLQLTSWDKTDCHDSKKTFFVKLVSKIDKDQVKKRRSETGGNGGKDS